MTIANADNIDQTLAVLVIYRQQIAESATLRTLVESLKITGLEMDLVIYDNSPASQPLNLHGDSFRGTYLHNPSNPGVATAYNEGLRIAHERGKKWLLLLDQDTSFPSDTLSIYCQAVQSGQAELYAPLLMSGRKLISPCYYWKGIGCSLSKTPEGLMHLKNRSVLNSGMLVNVEAMTKIGGFNERIPLDFADHDFCRRFADRYGKAFILDITCEHGFSDREETSLASALARFAFYCRGARFSALSLTDRFIHPIVVIIRCAVLSLRYRSWRFVPVMCSELIGLFQ